MENFLSTYINLNADNLELLSSIYSEDICFVDPAHELRGLTRLKEYFANLYSNISSIKFQFHNHLRLGDEGYVQWQMIFSHPRLKGGESINVAGASYLRFNDSGRVYFHRDYFDLGAMLYEQLPIMGRIIIALKRSIGT